MSACSFRSFSYPWHACPNPRAPGNHLHFVFTLTPRYTQAKPLLLLVRLPARFAGLLARVLNPLVLEAVSAVVSGGDLALAAVEARFGGKVGHREFSLAAIRRGQGGQFGHVSTLANVGGGNSTFTAVENGQGDKLEHACGSRHWREVRGLGGKGNDLVTTARVENSNLLVSRNLFVLSRVFRVRRRRGLQG